MNSYDILFISGDRPKWKQVKPTGHRKLKIINAFANVLLGFNMILFGELSLGTFVGRPNRKKTEFSQQRNFAKSYFWFPASFQQDDTDFRHLLVDH